MCTTRLRAVHSYVPCMSTRCARRVRAVHDEYALRAGTGDTRTVHEYALCTTITRCELAQGTHAPAGAAPRAQRPRAREIQAAKSSSPLQPRALVRPLARHGAARPLATPRTLTRAKVAGARAGPSVADCRRCRSAVRERLLRDHAGDLHTAPILPAQRGRAADLPRRRCCWTSLTAAAPQRAASRSPRTWAEACKSLN